MYATHLLADDIAAQWQYLRGELRIQIQVVANCKPLIHPTFIQMTNLKLEDQNNRYKHQYI
jgi:hypothetical protein